MKIKTLLISVFLLSACTAQTFGLKPLYPEMICRKDISVGDYTVGDCVVDSLQPVFRWEPFSPEKRGIGPAQAKKISNITYDLNIWSSVNETPAEVIYFRRGLSVNQHKMEQPLKPCSKYFWSIRVRFLVEGKERVSEWGRSKRPNGKSATDVERLRRWPVIPLPGLYHFETPCNKKME